MTGVSYDLQLYLSPPLPSSLASIKEANPGSPGKMAVKMEREIVTGFKKDSIESVRKRALRIIYSFSNDIP